MWNKKNSCDFVKCEELMEMITMKIEMKLNEKKTKKIPIVNNFNFKFMETFSDVVFFWKLGWITDIYSLVYVCRWRKN